MIGGMSVRAITEIYYNLSQMGVSIGNIEFCEVYLSRSSTCVSASMLWLERRWTRTAARLADTIPHKRHVLSPVLEAGEMCSFWM